MSRTQAASRGEVFGRGGLKLAAPELSAKRNAVNYYNENNPGAARWLRNLIEAGEIPYGHVDTRDIRAVRSEDLRGYTQCHFFAGIGGWSLALRLAGWPDHRPVWTGSCPCQPFSIAGRRKGTSDDRHLWPTFASHIRECRPARIFGEQVASRDGRAWLGGVRLDLEDLGYGVGAADLCAAGVGAPHIRQRLFFGAIRLVHADDDGRKAWDEAAAALGYGGMAYANGIGLQFAGRSGAMAGAASQAQSEGDQRERGGRPVRGSGSGSGGMGDAKSGRLARPARFREDAFGKLAPAERASPWADSEWLDCRDGKARRVKSGIRLLVDGFPRDVEPALSGYGNAIVPQVAAAFIGAFEDAIHSL